MTRDAFAAEGRRQQMTDRSKQQLSIDGADRQTDRRTEYTRPLHTTRATSTILNRKPNKTVFSFLRQL